MLVDGGRTTDVDRVLRQIHDIANGSGIPHVLIGEISAIWKAVNSSSLVSRIELVMQRFYDTDPANKKDHRDFVAIMKRCQAFIDPSTELRLTSHYSEMMTRVAGDPCRLFAWIQNGLLEAGRQGVEKLGWQHLRDTAPRLAHVTDAERALSNYKEYVTSTLFQFAPEAQKPTSDEPVSNQAASNANTGAELKPFEPKPRRDLVPKVA
jgi:hypothetical protein